MDKKTFEKQTKAYQKAKQNFETERVSRDRATHSENKTWGYNHSKGELTQNKE